MPSSQYESNSVSVPGRQLQFPHAMDDDEILEQFGSQC